MFDESLLANPNSFVPSSPLNEDPFLRNTPEHELVLSSSFDVDTVNQSRHLAKNHIQEFLENIKALQEKKDKVSDDYLTGMSAKSSLLAAAPDLVISNLATPSAAAPGSGITFDYTVKNQGSAAAGYSNTNFYLSKDTKLDSNDTYLGSDFASSLAAGASSTESASYLSIDSTIATGNYYLFAKADGDLKVAESNEGNNLAYKAITIAKPDLVISNLASPSIAEGDVFSFNYTIKNQGGYAGYSDTYFYLSKDTTLDSNDFSFNNYNFASSLAAGETRVETAYLSLNGNFSAGNYYLFAKADGELEVSESNEGNNLAYKAITINKPDLIVSNLVTPSSVTAGNYLNFSYTINNQGTAAATDWNYTKFYLSKDTILDSSDTILGKRFFDDSLAARATSTDSFSVCLDSKLTAGTYYLFAQADGEQDVFENNENNNLAYKAINILPSLDGYNAINGYGLVNAAAAVAKALGQNPFADVPNLGGNDWGADLINAPEVWAKGYTGKGIVVAVVDTGVDRNHSDLSTNIWSNSREIAGNGIDDDGNGYKDDVYGWNFNSDNNNTLDGHSHGTHVAGTIAGVKNNFGVTGIAYDAKIMPVKVLSDSGRGSDSGVAKGIRYAVDNGANVINLSLGGYTPNSELEAAIQYASSKGVIAVMAAGNDRSFSIYSDGLSPIYPAAYATKWGLAVGAVNQYNSLADFSNLAGANKPTYITAPGVDVYSTVPNNNYGFKSGTSMAAPHVAGVVALLLGAKQGLTDAQVRQLLSTTAENSSSSGNISQYLIPSSSSSQLVADTPANYSAIAQPQDSVLEAKTPVSLDAEQNVFNTQKTIRTIHLIPEGSESHHFTQNNSSEKDSLVASSTTPQSNEVDVLTGLSENSKLADTVRPRVELHVPGSNVLASLTQQVDDLLMTYSVA